MKTNNRCEMFNVTKRYEQFIKKGYSINLTSLKIQLRIRYLIVLENTSCIF